MKKSAATLKTLMLLCLLFFIVIFSGCQEKFTEKTSFAMGSILSAKIFSQDEQLNEEVFSLINSAVRNADKALSNTDENAEIYTLNKNGGIQASDYLTSVLSDSISVCNKLGRRVDISIGKLTSLWGFNTETPSLPKASDIEEQLPLIDIDKIAIDGNKIAIEDIEIDMGALGKGAACDAAFEAVKHKDIPFIMSLGGTVLAFGENPSGSHWTIGIRDPFLSANSYFATLKLAPKNAVFVSTSGSYEKTFTENSKTYHHILDPKTGYPVENELISVTVVSPSGITADALSTALFINGLNAESLVSLKSFSSEAVFVFKNKTYYVTDGLKEALELTSSDYKYLDYNEN
ncbi:MAG: FAD:protein FMN transferase [Clostridia bacterium]|nr:FAD:protein FMN transferase [Clostridia bacterium]